MGACKFQDEWMIRKDTSGHKIGEWAEKKGEHDVFCKACQCSFSIAKGFCRLKQHYETDKHQTNFDRCVNDNQLHITNEGNASDRGIRLYSVKDSAYTAELIWCLKMVAGNVSANFSQDIACTFKAMFPMDGAVPEQFSLNPTKVRYLMTDALGPYFKTRLLKDVGNSYYTLMFDETTNNAGHKELQTSIRFWSHEKKEIATHHLETFYMGHARADILKENILNAINNANLQLSKLLMVGSDGPKVNQKVFKLLNEEVKSIRGKGLVDIGFCNIHMIHNAFQKGLQELGSDASELIIFIYNYFKDWPSRREDFEICQNKKDLKIMTFIKHVNSRWLTIEPAAKRLLDQWDAIIEYFVNFVPSNQKSLMKTNSYKRIINLLKKNTIKAELKFVCISASLFTQFTGLYQRQEPLIHMMHHHIKDLVMSIANRSCKPEAVDKFKTSLSEDVFNNECLLPIKEMVLSEEISNLITHLKQSEKEEFISQMRKHYVAAGKYIVMKKVIFSKIFRSLSCIRPDQMKLKVSHKRLQILARSLPIPFEEEKLTDEWKLVQFEDMQPNARIDHFWSQVFSIRNMDGSFKYDTIAMIIKAALTLSHGNAEIERGFSRSSRIMTEDRASMSVRTLNARLNIADGLKMYNNKPYLVPITEELIKAARTAYKSYDNYRTKQKEEEEEEEKKKLQAEEAQISEEEKIKELDQNKEDIDKLKSKLDTVKKSENVQISAVDKLLEEANENLKKAIQKNDISGVQVAQAMLEGAMKSNDECKLKRKAIGSLEKELHKKKDKVITNFFSKKPKTS